MAAGFSMPTNKLWLEHTERAAWESVQALREKLADAEKRIQRMAPPAGGWPQIFELLDRAQQQHGLSGTTHAELIRELLTKYEETSASLQNLRQELAQVRDTPTSSAPLQVESGARRKSTQRVFIDDEDEFDTHTQSGSRFLSDVQRQYQTMSRDASNFDVDTLFRMLEAQVDDLSELEEPELPEALVELAALAMRLEQEFRRASQREKSTQTPEI